MSNTNVYGHISCKIDFTFRIARENDRLSIVPLFIPTKQSQQNYSVNRLRAPHYSMLLPSFSNPNWFSILDMYFTGKCTDDCRCLATQISSTQLHESMTECTALKNMKFQPVRKATQVIIMHTYLDQSCTVLSRNVVNASK